MLNRRKFLTNSAMLGAGAALGSMPAFQAMAQEKTMRLYWWGTPNRAERTLGVAKLFEAANAGVKINGEVGGNDYWTKLTTMMAGGNAPDIYQLEPGRFADFARRGAALPLNDYLGKSIRTTKLAPGVLDLGTVDGKVTGMPLSLNAFALFYDMEAFKKAGLTPPSATTTWEDFAKLSVELTKSIGKKNVWATGNCSRYLYAFQSWLTQRGKLLYTPEGTAGFTADDATAWYTYWNDLAKAGGCSSAEVQAMDKLLVDSNPMATGNAVMAIAFSNQLTAFQGISKTPLAITSMPILNASAPSGLFYRPGLHWAIASTSKNPELAAKFIDYFINEPEAGKALQVERGVPVNTDIQALVQPSLDDVSKLTVDYIKSIEGRVGKYPPPVPLGASEFEERSFRPMADKVAFGQVSPKDAGEQLMADAKRILKA